MKVIITDYDTVKIANEKEITREDYLKSLREKIKKGKIFDCTYDSESETFTYTEEDKGTYKVDLSRSKKNIGIFLSLVELFKVIQKNEYEEEKILEKAESGVIDSEYEKEIYLKKLKQSISISGFLKGLRFGDIFLDTLEDAEYGFPEEVAMIDIILGIGAPIFLIIFSKYWIALIVFLACAVQFCIHAGLEMSTIHFIITLLINTIKGLINISKENKVIKHKIKNIKNITFQEEKILDASSYEEKCYDSLSNCIMQGLNNIYEKLVYLNEFDKKRIKTELESELKKYREELSKSSKQNVEQSLIISSKFMLYLSEVNKKIDSLLAESVNNKEIQTEEVSIDKGGVLVRKKTK